MKSESALCALLSVLALVATMPASAAAQAAANHDLLLRGGTIYDGSGAKPYVGDVLIDGDRIAYVGPHSPATARTVVDASRARPAPGPGGAVPPPRHAVRPRRRAPE